MNTVVDRIRFERAKTLQSVCISLQTNHNEHSSSTPSSLITFIARSEIKHTPRKPNEWRENLPLSILLAGHRALLLRKQCVLNAANKSCLT